MKAFRLGTVILVNLKLCFLEIYTNRTRSMITTLGIFLGVAALLANLAFVRGMDDDLKENMERVGGLNILTIQAVEPVSREEKMKFQFSPGLSLAEAEEVVRELPYVKAVLRYKNLGWNRMTAGGKRTGGILIAVSREYLNVYNYRVERGRDFTEEDFKRCRYVCIIGKRMAERLFDDGSNPVGETLLIRNIPLTIIGIIQTDNVRNERASECIFPFTAYVQRFSNAKRNLSEISLLLADSDFVRQAQREVTHVYLAKHRGAKDFEIEASMDKLKEMETAAKGMKIILWSIAAISLIVGGISIMNIMFATIGDRIREIGIRKALGAQRHDIFTQFMIEAILVCFVGGIPGMVLGALVTAAPTGFFPYIPRLTVLDYTIAFGFTLFAGVFSGLFPALRAANMQPVEALRY
jgi:ABC-type antimicrobial peptide transport system permease subunit